MFIGISGIIGAGKSTLAQNLAKHLGYEAFNEPVKDNPYLEDFYTDMNRWGAMMQIHLLFRRFEQHQQIVWNSKKGAVQDRTIYEDSIFARMLYEEGFIDQRDYDTYLGHFNLMKRLFSISRSLDLSTRGSRNEPPKNCRTGTKSRGWHYSRVYAKTSRRL